MRVILEGAGKVEATLGICFAIACRAMGRGAGGKIPVFGLLKRNGYVHAMLIPNAASATLLPIIREKIRPHSVVYTDSFRAYDVLDVSEFHHYRINHSKLFAEKNNHINRCLAGDVYIAEKGNRELLELKQDEQLIDYQLPC